MYAGTNIVHPRNVGFRRVASAILFIFEGGDKMEKLIYAGLLVGGLVLQKWIYGEVTNSMLIVTTSLLSTFVLLDAIRRR